MRTPWRERAVHRVMRKDEQAGAQPRLEQDQRRREQPAMLARPPGEDAEEVHDQPRADHQSGNE
jgi:hypothetical protein